MVALGNKTVEHLKRIVLFLSHNSPEVTLLILISLTCLSSLEMAFFWASRMRWLVTRAR